MTQAMRNVFFIAYEFPPLNVGGSQRPLKFVKYLREFGINPIVFCLAPESYPKVFSNYKLDRFIKNDGLIKTGCFGVGLSRLAFAYLANNGLDKTKW